jgi:hypothetical protein
MKNHSCWKILSISQNITSGGKLINSVDSESRVESVIHFNFKLLSSSFFVCQRWVCLCGNVGQTCCSLSENYPGIYPQIMMKIINDSQDKWHQTKMYEYTYTTCMQINYPLCELACSESLDSVSVKQILPLHSGPVIHALQMCSIHSLILHWPLCSRTEHSDLSNTDILHRHNISFLVFW